MAIRKFTYLTAVVAFIVVPLAHAATPCPLSTASPSVTICTPTNGSTVTSPFQVWAGTTDTAHPVTAMKVYLDSVAVYAINANVVNTTLSAAAGSHHLSVNAWDSSGAVFKSTLTFTVSSPPAGVTVAPSNVGFANQVVGTTSSPQSVTLTNGTTSAISVGTLTVTGDFLVSNNGCGASLAANSSCVVQVQFKPTTTGTRTGTLTITDSPDATSPHQIGLSGSGVTAPACTPSTVNPSVTVCAPLNGETVSSPFQVLAETTDSHTVIAMKVYVDSVAVYSVNASQVNTTLTAAAGLHHLGVNAWDSTGAVFTSTLLAFTVSPTPSAPSVAPSSLSFGNQQLKTTSAPQSVTVNNPTTGTLGFNAPTVAGDFAIANDGCGASLAASSSCVIQVQFTPTATGTRTGALTITDSPDAGSPHTVNLSGTGTYPLSVSPVSLSFGDQALNLTSSPQKVTLSNVSGSSINLTLALSGDYAENDNCGTSLGANSSCTVSVTFTPTTTGARSGSLAITYNAAGSPQSVSLAGSGVTVTGVAVTPASPTINVGQKKQFTATATYSDNTSADVTVSATWSSSDTSVATIDNTAPSQGLATGLAQGQSTIQASFGGSSDTTVLTVVPQPAFAGVLTFHNDNLRTGQNTTETVLTPANVNVTNFGKLFSYSVDGRIYAQPLYVPNVSINGVSHNVVYVATEADSVYAFDADGLSTAPLWKVNFTNPAAGITTVNSSTVGSNVTPQIGITGTPVIDPDSGTLYCLADTVENGVYHWRLHAVDITSGAEKFGGPVDVTASGFIPEFHLQRPGLLLANGKVYFGFGSNGDHNTWHGWIFGYDAQTLLRAAVYNDTPTGNGGGVWMGAGGLGADANGNVYFATGNGSNNISTGGSNLSDSFVKLDLTGAVADYFTPFNHTNLDCCDLDLASGGPVLLPDQSGPHPHVMIGGGKNKVLYVMDRENMGKFNSTTNNIIQTLSGAVGPIFDQPAYWNGKVYVFASVDAPKAFSIADGILSAAPVSMATTTFAFPGANPSISSDNNTNGIVWAQNFNSASSILYAYDANNLAAVLWNSNQNATRDSLGQGEKFMAPTIANGKVYIGTTSKLIVYGLLH